MSDRESNVPRIGHWIGGQSVDSADHQTFLNVDPETGECLAEVLLGNETEIVAAVEAAQIAQQRFAATGPSEREAILHRAADLLRRDQDDFIDLLIREIGSPVSKARLEIAIATRTLSANASLARRMTGRTYPSDVPGRMSFAIRQPLGVVAGITPFNVPLVKGVKHSSTPIATGNSFVWLPSQQAPLLANRLATLYAEAGVPAGVFNVVHGEGGVLGPALIKHPSVQAVSFTGSAQVGRQVQAACGEFQKRVTLELGGKNPILIFEDADLKQAVSAAVRGAFIYQGQICMASSRIIVHKNIAGVLTDSVVAAASALSCGDLRDPSTVIGPVIDQAARQRIDDHLNDAVRLGATIQCGNVWNGNRMNPTVVTGVTSEMRLYREESFGPLVTIEVADDEAHAMQLAHASSAMLSAAVFTRDLDRAMRVSRSLCCGMVHVNEMTIQQEPEVPFGGDGGSGFGREGLETGVEDYTKWKWITINGSASAS
ncbi:aldehyde dehydrogenase family protein [Rhodopirellula sp. MGV]|uniref:aldehyde dehydrogenase family protein n=1 Tax=Rhodopirellula sp. MGV TaxID=2023130 RepID=UPI0013045387|nr:aldehyde dehydrogenase family protein [Rhodopirellula sp. MGV]